MPITAADIQLLESERMRDTADGGGRQTGRIIPSGLAGNVFPKVSRVDSVYGRVNLRKIYIAVRTATLDMYAGAHAIITDPPGNERISCCLFSTGSAFDQRTEARNRIESYVVAGPLARMRLYGDQLIGQKAILVYQRSEEPLPDVGDVLVLSVEAAGYAAAEQYVRITDVSHEERTFTDGSGDYSRRVLALKIGSPLTQTFKGAEPSRYSTDPSPTKVRVTQVADASQYFGIQPLAEEALSGALTLRLASVYAPLVPSTQRETAVSLASVTGVATYEASSAAGRTVSGMGGIPGDGISISRFVGSSILPGSLSVTHFQFAAAVAVDDGDGNIVPVAGSGTFQITGEANYATGEIRVASNVAGAELIVRYVVGSPISGPAHTRAVPVTLATRGAVYAETLAPLPAPGTLIVDFRALGRWYRLRDDGTGQLVANDPSEGTGSVDYVTGAVVITLGALPDVDSAVLFAWGSPAHYTIRAGATADASSALRLQYRLAQSPIVPGSLTISYPVGGVSRSATDAAANGTITGTGVSGTINYATGEVVLDFTAPPDRAASLANAYTWRDGAGLLSGTTATISGGRFTVPGNAPFRNGGTMLFNVTTSRGAVSAAGYITSGGQVHVRAGAATLQIYRAIWLDQPVGTFDAATGVVTITNAVAMRILEWLPEPTLAWVGPIESVNITGVSSIAVERDTAAYDPNAVTGEAVAPGTVGLTLDLTSTVADPVVAGSVMFRATGKTYVDRNGTLYADIDPATGSSTAAGSIDYETGVCSLTWWADNVAADIAVDACLTTYGEWTATTAFFRTAGSPIRPASFYVQATTPAGALVSATADQNGVITGNGITGTINQTMGVVSVDFGQQILPGTIRYNCVVLSNLPLDASILGLDPVRLPSDGRVPIFRPGDVVVIHHTQQMMLTNPVAAGQTYSVGRTGLATLRLNDATGADVATNRYAVDLAAGTVTIAADWTGAGVTQPLTAVHRIEDMALTSDVQINGQIDIAAALPRTYPLGSYVSSALLFGDLQAIVTNLYDQATWTGVWSDALIGSQSNAQYDDINHPVEVINRSAVTERWRINFTSTTEFQVVGENLGVIVTGTTAADCSPLNPVTGEAYFVLRAAGWGGGWSAGNQLRFNTIGASGPTWVARTILAGASLAGDSFDIEARGDVD